MLPIIRFFEQSPDMQSESVTQYSPAVSFVGLVHIHVRNILSLHTALSHSALCVQVCPAFKDPTMCVHLLSLKVYDSHVPEAHSGLRLHFSPADKDLSGCWHLSAPLTSMQTCDTHSLLIEHFSPP
jgi:hypothetical protein